MINNQSDFHSETNAREMLGIQRVYLSLIDYRQAYDNVEREKIYRALEYFQIPNKLIRLVKATMDNMAAKVQLQTEMTELLEIRDGLKQGDGLAPLLFNLVMEY